MPRRFPKPWQVDEYATPDGRRVAMVRAADHAAILQPTEDIEFVRAVVAAANEGADLDAIASIQARWQAALDAAHAETERVREHFRKEAADAIREVYRLREELEEMKADRPRPAPRPEPAPIGPRKHRPLKGQLAMFD